MQRRHPWDPVCPPPTGLVRPVPVDPTGTTGPTRGQARGAPWRRTTHGFYVPAEVTDELPEQRILEQSMRLPPGGAVTGWASCRLWTAAFFDGLDRDGITRLPVPLALGADGQIRPAPGSVVNRDRLLEREIAVIAGIRCTRRLRAAFDAMRWAEDVREAVVALEMMAAARQVSVRQMREYVGQRSGWTGAGQAREALDFAGERSRSPNETRSKMTWQVDADLPPPLVNQPIWDRHGRLLGYADLLDVDSGLVGEFDGADHAGARRRSKDATREGRLRDVDLEVVRIMGVDLDDRRTLTARLHAARNRAKWLPPAQRRWTLDPPSGWPQEMSLDEELALRACQEDQADS